MQTSDIKRELDNNKISISMENCSMVPAFVVCFYLIFCGIELEWFPSLHSLEETS